MKQLLWIVALVACGKKDKPAPSGETTKPTTTEPGAAAPGSGSASAAAGSGSAAVAPAANDKCKQPCLLLKDTKLADARAQCADWAIGKDGKDGCDAADHARNCIYASYG